MITNWFWNKSRRIVLRHSNRKIRTGVQIRVLYGYRDYENRNKAGV
jgi:hypothetical protein